MISTETMIEEGVSVSTSNEQVRLPGAGAAVRVKVYDQPTNDGKIGGTPHVHLLSTEMYFVLAGSGAVEIIDAKGFQTIPLNPFDALVFTPGTIHRLLNPNGNLELLVIEQGGFPQHGDVVICAPEEILQDAERYRAARTIQNFEDARRRQSVAVDGFNALRDAFLRSSAEGLAAIRRFYQGCYARTNDLYPAWRKAFDEGVLAEAMECLARLEDLAEGNTSRLLETRHKLMSPKAYDGIGYCGYLDKYSAASGLLR